MSHFRKAWQSLNYDKEYIFGFETCNTPKRKENLKWHHLTPLNRHVNLLFHTGHTKSRKLFTQTFSPFAKMAKKILQHQDPCLFVGLQNVTSI